MAERKQGRWVFYNLAEAGRRWWESLAADLAEDPHLANDAQAAANLRQLGAEGVCKVGVEAVGGLPVVMAGRGGQDPSNGAEEG